MKMLVKTIAKRFFSSQCRQVKILETKCDQVDSSMCAYGSKPFFTQVYPDKASTVDPEKAFDPERGTGVG